MSILKYFNRKEHPVLLTENANSIVRKTVNEESEIQYNLASSKKRGNYMILTDEMRAKVAKYAFEHGTPKTMRHFTDFNLKESTVRHLKKTYRTELFRKRKLYLDEEETELPRKKRGRPLMLGEVLDNRVQELVSEIRDAGGIINTRIVRAVAKGVVIAEDRTLLLENGGAIEITRQWALSLLKRMKMVKQRGSSTAKIEVKNLEELRTNFLSKISEVVQEHNIPPQLVINYDHTGVHLLPVSIWTTAEKGTEKVTIDSLDDKREITGVMACTWSGEVLPPHVIYKGKTDACHTKYNFPKEWDITHTKNHWANTETSFRYLDKIIVPYVNRVRDEFELPLRQKALIILDFFSAQLSEPFRNRMKELGLTYVYVPPNCTSELQPMDLSVQKIVKDKMHDNFESWYTETVAKKLKRGENIHINLGMGVLIPLSAKWLVSAVDYIQANPEKVYNGFKKVGIC